MIEANAQGTRINVTIFSSISSITDGGFMSSRINPQVPRGGCKGVHLHPSPRFAKKEYYFKTKLPGFFSPNILIAFSTNLVSSSSPFHCAHSSAYIIRTIGHHIVSKYRQDVQRYRLLLEEFAPSLISSATAG